MDDNDMMIVVVSDDVSIIYKRIREIKEWSKNRNHCGIKTKFNMQLSREYYHIFKRNFEEKDLKYFH
jgi:hypothetical protein